MTRPKYAKNPPKTYRVGTNTQLAERVKQLEDLLSETRAELRKVAEENIRLREVIRTADTNQKNRSAVASPKVEIAVIDCCGVFGYLIPWPDWKVGDKPIVPTRNMDREHVFLYSCNGQMGHGPRGLVDPNRQRQSCLGSVNMDLFTNWESKVVDWNQVRKAIERYW